MDRSPAVFLKIDERINIALPAVLLMLLVFGFSIDGVIRPSFSQSASLTERILLEIIFLNVTHNAFTVMMIASFPELRPWVIAQGNGSAFRFFLKTSAIFIGLAAAISVALLSGSKLAQGLFAVAGVFFPIQHAIAQSLGLSLVYNGKAQEAPEKTKRTEWFERRLVIALIFLIVASVLVQTVPSLSAATGSYRIFGFGLGALLFPISLTLGVVIVGLMFFYPRSIRMKKSLFALRFPIWAYALISPFGLMATQAIHGLEYLFVFRKMANASKFGRWKMPSLIILFLVIVFGMFRVIFSAGSMFPKDQAPVWLSLLAAISIAFSFLHYYLDRKLFLMRDPTNRQTVGSLLK
ncbi:MAG: hypothetical protein J0L82_09845 [Deltaproteobacteria bacterium]|nr:hypothetical protein [Deltaproteobacteria bacterium]